MDQIPLAQEQPVNMLFPTGGIDLSTAYGAQNPGTTPVGINVRAFDAGTLRMRGGSRPGLTPFIGGTGNTTQVNGFNLIQHVASLVWVSSSAVGG